MGRATPGDLRRGRALTLIAAMAMACLLGFSANAWATTRTVENTSDSGSGSLRNVIASAENGDVIVFEASLDGETIHLTTGAIEIEKSLTIEGPGASELTIDAGGSSQIFTVTAGSVSISGLTLAGGMAPEEGGAIYSESTGSLSVSDCAFTGNTAGEDGGAGAGSGIGHGGAIYASFSAASLSVSDCTFAGNAAGGNGGSGERGGRGRGGAIDYHGAGALTISNSSFTGNAAGGDGEVGPQGGLGRGGAIFVSEFAASTSVVASTFTTNTAGGDGGAGNLSGRGEGGAIQGESGTGPVTITGSTFTDNVAGGRDGAGAGSGAAVGGAIESFSSLTITDSTFTGNAAAGQGGSGEGAFGLGGAIHNFNNVSPLIVTGSTFVDNSAGGQGGSGVGGAIDATSVSGRSASITNSTFVGNTAGGGGTSGSGGAIEVVDMTSVTLASVTIDENEVGAGGSGAGLNSTEGAIVGGAAVTAKATIVSGNTGASNCDVPVASSTYSLEGPTSGDTSCGFDRPSADPELKPLADNGGPTETQALPAGSPAVDVAPVAQCPTKVDQRGEPRPDSGELVCDVGAYELQDPTVAPGITSAAMATFQVGKQGSFTITATGLPKPELSEAGALPKGVSFTDHGDGTASLSGKPASGTGGSYPITIKASNGTPPDDMQSFALTVQAPPTASIAIPVANATYTQGQAVSSSFTCKEGPGGPGIASCADQAGRSSGAPLDTAKTGKHTFTVTATSSDGLLDKATVTYRVAKGPKPSGPQVSILSGRVRVVGRVAKVRLACNGGAAGDTCHGKLSLTRRGRALAGARYKFASGQTQRVRLRLNDAGMRLLRRAHRHRLRVTATAGKGVQRTIVLKLKRRPRRA